MLPILAFCDVLSHAWVLLSMLEFVQNFLDISFFNSRFYLTLFYFNYFFKYFFLLYHGSQGGGIPLEVNLYHDLDFKC